MLLVSRKKILYLVTLQSQNLPMLHRQKRQRKAQIVGHRLHTEDALGCRAATVAFLKGWTDRIKELGYKSGTYGSPKNAQEDWQFMPPASRMDAIWMARWDNVPSVWTYITFPGFPTNVWNDHQRIKQWQAPHNETWGGVTFNIATADGTAQDDVPSSEDNDYVAKSETGRTIATGSTSRP